MKRFILAGFIILVSGLALFPGKATSADFTVTLPAGSAVTMGDASAELPFAVFNNGPGDIRDITFTINTALYNFSAATMPPAGWCIKTFAAGSIEFALQQGGGACSSGATASQITSGQSKTFTITLTGPAGGLIPAAAADVTTDTLTGVTVSVQGGFTLSGGLPVWTRKALAVSLTASPATVAVGDTITLTMNVSNRSTTSKSDIAANPDPPARTYTGGASVSPVGAAVNGSTASTTNPAPVTLSSNIAAGAVTIPVSSTAGYSGSGTIIIENELFGYDSKNATSFTGATPTAASHDGGTLVYSQNTSAFTLTPGETGSITWLFKADANGTVYFSAAARNSAGTATSKNQSSNTVVIGSFTATITQTPLSVVSGQVVTVTMTVANNGTSTLASVTPSITPGGTAVKSLSTGPTPGSIASLAPGETGTFTWTYVITGSPSQTYLFSGSATAGAQTTNNATTETGEINQYAVSESPSVFATGSSGSITWTVYNRGGATVKEVKISIPGTGNCVTGGWGYSSNTPPANWTAATAGAPVSSVTFTANNPVDTNGIPVGGSMNFTITFGCVPQVVSDTDYTFPVLITDKNGNQATINTTITVTAYSLTLQAFAANCVAAAPPTQPADGNSRYCLQATLLIGGSPAPGRTITFSITAGSGFLGAGSAVTDGSGVATVMLTSPCSNVNVATTVRAQYTVDTFDDITLQFTGVAGAVLSYVNNSLTFNGVNPVSINTGDIGQFSLQVRNCGTGNLAINAANTTFAVRQNAADTFILNNAAPNPINAGATATLTFNAGTIASGTLQCTPFLTVDAGPGYMGQYSFFQAPPGNFLPIPGDTVTVNGGAVCPPPNVRILDWREVIN